MGSIFKIPIFIIENRLTNNTFFTDTYVISKNVDHIAIAVGTLLWLALSLKGKARIIVSAIYSLLCVFTFSAGNVTLADITVLISIPIILSFLTYNKISNNLILNVYTGLTVNYFAIICTALGILSIVLSSSVLIYSSQPTAMPVRNYAFMIYLLASSASTIMMFLLVFCVPLKFLMNEIEKAIKFKQGIFAEATAHSQNKKPLRIRIFYLSLIACLSYQFQ